MRKVISFCFALMAAISINAEEYYLVGDATPIGWSQGESRKATQMTETEPGVYVWTGLLKHGGEGFKICDHINDWGGYRASEPNFEIGDSGSDECFYVPESNRDFHDYKWNPKNTEWQTYTITLDTNKETLSWKSEDDSLDVLEPAEDGIFYIGTAEELNKLAFMISNNPISYNVKLKNDIDYSDYKTAISSTLGSESSPFKGEFDGQNHTINIDLETNTERMSLFGTNAGQIHNLRVTGKITVKDKNQVGGICGYMKEDGSKIYNCISEVEIIDNQNGDGTLAGICAVTDKSVTIENCAFYGKINAPGRDGNGGIISWASSGASTTIKNCIVVAEINWKDGADYGRNNPSVSNCYKVDASDDRLNNGDMTYMLNNKVSGGEDWFQTLGVDMKPSPLSSSKKLYANGSFYCDGVTSKGGDIVLSNEDEAIVDPHAFGDNGVCTGCMAVGQEATETDGVFQLNNAGNLLWWAQYVNAGHPAANAVLTANVSMEGVKYVPAGTTDSKYVGTFDGQEHTVTLAIDNPTQNYQGLFGVATDGATIKNVIVNGSVKGDSYVAGIVGGSNGGEEGKTLNIINCGNEATIIASGANGAGIIGVNMSGVSHFLIKNCYNTGDVTSSRESGAITGWTGDNSTIENCYNVGGVTNGDGDGFLRGNIQPVNCYNRPANAAIASGELCYKLNAGGDNWYQNIGEDDKPLPFSTHAKVRELSVTEAGYATFVPEVNIATLPEGVEAYAAQNMGTYVHLEPVTGVPADNAVVVKATKGNYYYNGTDANVALEAQNDLTFSDTETEADGTQYVLAKVGDETGFYKAAGTIAARKAYLQNTSGVKVLYFGSDDATGIAEVENEARTSTDATVYNLAGQRVTKVQKGINIVNGKKILF